MKMKYQTLLLFGLLTIVVMLAAMFFLTRYFMNTATINTIEKKSTTLLTFLVAGIDGKTSSDKGRTDSLFVVFYNTQTHKIFIYDIPRDLRVRVKYDQSLVYDKINHVYAKKSIWALKESVENIIGVKIPYYVLIDYSSVASIVDMVNGIKVDVPEDMKYTDRANNLFINISKGLQILDGEKSVEYLRYRSDSQADLGRIKRQVNFMYLILQKKNELLRMSNVKNVLKILYQKVSTNITLQDFYNLATELEKVDTSRFYFDQLLTKPLMTNGVAYLVPLNVQGGNFGQYQVKKAIAFLAQAADQYDRKVTVEILNGSPKAGNAKLLRDKLVNFGVDVLFYGNANTPSKETKVIDRTGNLEKANQIGVILRCKLISTEVNKSLGVDVTIIVGEDFNIDSID